MNGPALLFAALAEPRTVAAWATPEWNAVIRSARAENLLGTLAVRCEAMDTPPRARALLDEAAATALRNHDVMRFEVQRMAIALRDTDVPVVLMKGAAYLMADLPPLPGRNIGDLDIMVPFAALERTEAALIAHGWRRAKARGTYDDDYYRRWMHELPPLAHPERGGVVDLHHTILPRTARLTPDAALILERRAALADPAPPGIAVMAPADMLLHAATHLAYDGDFAGGARNLWDVDRLTRHFAEAASFWDDLARAAGQHGTDRPARPHAQARESALRHTLAGRAERARRPRRPRGAAAPARPRPLWPSHCAAHRNGALHARALAADAAAHAGAAPRDQMAGAAARSAGMSASHPSNFASASSSSTGASR